LTLLDYHFLVSTVIKYSSTATIVRVVIKNSHQQHFAFIFTQLYSHPWANYTKFIYRSSGSLLVGQLLMQLESKVSGVSSGTQSKKSKKNRKGESTRKRGIAYPDFEEKKKPDGSTKNKKRLRSTLLK